MEHELAASMNRRIRSAYDEARYQRNRYRAKLGYNQVRMLSEREIRRLQEAVEKARHTPLDQRRGMST